MALPDIKNLSKLHQGMECDFLPESVLSALAQPPSVKDNLGPVNKKLSNKTNNVWHFQNGRSKLKHLTDNTICSCGAGR